MRYESLKKYYDGRKVFVTGHTGFKGAWLCKILSMLGASVYGYALEAPTNPSVYELLHIRDALAGETIADIRDYDALCASMKGFSPDVVFHLAAQPIVRESYRRPRDTFEINVMGTVNVLEAARNIGCIRSLLNVTTDKVYENLDEMNHPFREDEKLDGYDPYSNSKSCSELVTHSYRRSFFSHDDDMRISTARAGNVIGGGDFASDRIIPDCVRATISGQVIEIRNPNSTRPFQHVLEPLAVYLMIAMKQADDSSYADYYNVGPDRSDCISASRMAELFVECWGDGASYKSLQLEGEPHEAGYLELCCDKLKSTFGWKSTWDIGRAVRETVAWYKAWHSGERLDAFTTKQIESFFA